MSHVVPDRVSLNRPLTRDEQVMYRLDARALRRAQRGLRSQRPGHVGALDAPGARWESLEERRLMAALPYRLDFDAAVGGTLADKDGQGTGFTSVQQNRNNNAYQPARIDLDTSAGVLKITTNGTSAAGGNAGTDNSLLNALQTEFDGSTGTFEVSGKLVGGLGIFSQGYEQGGIFFGPDQDNFIKLVALYHNFDGPRLEFADEYSDGNGGTTSTVSNGRIFVGDWSQIDSIDLKLVANPVAGTVTAFYRLNSATAWSQVPHTITIPSGKRAAFFNSAAKAGILGFDKSDAEDITVTWDYFDIRRQPAATGPSVSAMRPAVGTTDVRRDSFIAVDLTLPNGAIDPSTVSGTTVYLVNNATGATVAATANVSGGGDAITLTPSGILAANTTYTFHITSGVKDVTGAAFQAFSGSFTTGQSVAESNPKVAFNKQVLDNTVGIGWTGVTVGPDGKLYGVTDNGDIYRFDINSNGTLANRTQLFSYETATGVKRLITGIVFDTSQGTLTAYVSHGQWIDPGNESDRTAADWTGKITRFSGANLATRQDVIINLPRSVYDHLNNQAVFGPDGRLYFVMASNSAMGAPDSTWGNRPERLMTGAVLAADVRSITNTPVDVKTQDGGTYDPYAAGAKVQIYATGIRNGYDLVWTSAGHLFVPANGSAAGGNTPSGPGVPAINGVNQTQHDYLFKVVSGGYYGHPNPLRQEYVLNGGNPTAGADPAEVSQYPVGTLPDADYKGFAYDFGLNVSPNGVIEYNSNGAHFGGALDGKLLVVRYSGGDDILILDVDSAGNITKAYGGSFGMTGLIDPLDLIQDPTTGNLYVVEAGFRSNGGDANGLRISLLKPVAAGAAAQVTSPRLRNDGAGDTLHFSDVRGDSAAGIPHRITITNTGTGPLALPADAFQITGSGASRFSIANGPALPSSIAPGASVTFDVLFTANAKGIVTASLTIKTNDASQPARTFALRGLGTVGEGGSNEPSLQRILDLYNLPINVGDPDAETTDYPSTSTVSGSDEVLLQLLKRAGSGPVTIELLASMGTANSNSYTNTSALSWYSSASPATKNALLSIAKAYAQTVNVTASGSYSFNPSGDFGLVGTFYDFGPRDVWTEDSRNTWESNSSERRKVRFFPLKDADGNVVPNAYVFAFEEYDLATDQNDIVGIIRNVQPAGDPANAQLTNTDTVPFPDRLIFNRIRDLDPTLPNLVHDTATLTIRNTGGQPLTISSLVLSSNDWQITSGGTGGGTITLAPGASHNVTLKFVYNDPSGLGSKVRTGTLTINSNDADSPTQTVQLAGLWQSDSEQGNNASSQEPNLSELLEVLGYGIDVGPKIGRDSNTGQNTGGRVEKVGSETLSAYWRKADSSKPVTILQVAAWHQQKTTTNTSTFWFAQGGNSYWMFQHEASYGQSFLPPNKNGQPRSTATFDPGSGVWGLRFDSTFSDPALNANQKDNGHGMRWFALHDREGNLIPDAWLVAHDYVGTDYANYDYQDNIYLVWNAKPVSGPTAPTGAGATGSTGGNYLTWAANTEGNVAGYDVYRSDSPTGTFTKINSSRVTATSFNDADAPVGQTRYYRIVAVDYHGTSGSVTTVSATRPEAPTAPAAPSGLAASGITHSSATLNWNDNSNDETGFRIQRAIGDGAFATVATVAADVTSWTDTGLTPGTGYRYRVVAYNAVGNSSASNTVSVTTLADPAEINAPQNLRATMSAFDSVSLAWDDASDNESGFRLQRRTGGGAWITLAELPAGTEAHTDATVEPEKAYEYRVLAVNSYGQSPASNVISVTTPSDPGDVDTPAGLTSTVVEFNRVVLSWIDNSSNETGFRIERSTDGGAYVVLGSASGNATSYTDTTVAPQTQYRYRVVAVNSFGESTPSNVHTVTTPRDPAQVNAPGDLRLTGLDAHRVSFAWDDNSDNETGFRIERAINDGAWTTLATLIAGATSYNDNSAQPQTSYRYRVVAFNTVGTSDASNTLSTTTPADPTKIAAPTGLAASAPVYSQVNLSWSDNSNNESGFVIQRRLASGGDWTQMGIVGEGGESFIDTGVAASTAYVYRVAARNAVGQSPWSTEVSVTTPSADAYVSDNIGGAAGSTNVVTPRTGFDIVSTGSGVGGTGDGLRFVHRPMVGDFDYVVRLDSFDKATSAAAAGLMVRGSLAPDSANIFLRASGEVRLSYRDTDGAGSGGVGLANTGIPVYLRLVRIGDVFTAHYGSDGANWTQLGQATVNLPQTVRFGLAVTSYSDNASTARFRDLGVYQQSVPEAPDDFAAQVQGSRSVQLIWSDASNNEIGFRLQRRAAGSNAWTTIANLSDGSHEFIDTGVSPGGSYEYRLVAFNDAGDSSARTASAQIPDNRPSTPPSLDGNSGGATTGGSDRGASLSWGNGGDLTGSYRVERREGTSGAWKVLTVIPGTATSLRDASAEPGKTYQYRVVAIGENGESAPTAPFTLTTAPDFTLNRPAVTGEALSDIATRLRWSDTSDGESHYVVQRRRADGEWVTLARLPAGSEMYVDASLRPDTSYQYRVRAEAAGEVGAWSASVRVATPTVAQWQSTQIGIANGGATVIREGVHYDLMAGGRDVWGFADELGFVYRNVSGDFDYAVRLLSLSGDDPGRMAGLMVRTTAAAGSKNVFVKARESDARLTSRRVADGQTVGEGSVAIAFPNVWLRLRRAGTNVTGYVSADGVNWTKVASVSIGLGHDVLVGVAASAHSEDESAVARFRDLTDYRERQTLPSAPRNLAVNTGDSLVDLTWNHPMAAQLGFVIQRRSVGGLWQTLGFVGEGVTTYTDTTAESGNAYRYRVAAESSAGVGTFGDEVAVSL